MKIPDKVYDVLDSPILVDIEAKGYCTRLFGAVLGSQEPVSPGFKDEMLR
jgi:hypothetical protein